MFILTEKQTGKLIEIYTDRSDAYTKAMETPDAQLFSLEKKYWKADSTEAIVVRFFGHARDHKFEHWIVPASTIKGEIMRRHMARSEGQEVDNGREVDMAILFKAVRDGDPALRRNADYLREKREEKYEDVKKQLNGYGINLDHVAP